MSQDCARFGVERSEFSEPVDLGFVLLSQSRPDAKGREPGRQTDFEPVSEHAFLPQFFAGHPGDVLASAIAYPARRGGTLPEVDDTSETLNEMSKRKAPPSPAGPKCSRG